MCSSPICIHPLLASETVQGVRKPNSLGTKEDVGSRFSKVRSVKSRDGKPQHLGVFTWPTSVYGICYRKLEDGPKADLLWAVGRYIHCLGPVWGDVIRRLVRHRSNMFAECLLQARLELDGQGDLEWARLLPTRALSRSWIREACTKWGTWTRGNRRRSLGPGSPSKLRFLTCKVA